MKRIYQYSFVLCLALLCGAFTHNAQAQTEEKETVLHITTGNASNGEASIRLRNSAEADKGQPLFMVDGVVVSKNSEGLLDLDPNNIASIVVYKGAKAIAKGGMEAKDGLIMIYTKQYQAPKKKWRLFKRNRD